MSAIVSELQQRWRAMFAALERGDDVPPSTGLRAEGLMEAAVLTGQATPGELDAKRAVVSSAAQAWKSNWAPTGAAFTRFRRFR